jgi:hypothetical protein
MLLHVQYQNGRFDYVQAAVLDAMIASGRVMRLFRPSDREWATVGVDSFRGSGGPYAGTDRRQGEDYSRSATM